MAIYDTSVTVHTRRAGRVARWSGSLIRRLADRYPGALPAVSTGSHNCILNLLEQIFLR